MREKQAQDESLTYDENGRVTGRGKEGLGGLLFIADLSTSLGAGTFLVGNEFGRNPYYDYVVTLRPTWEFKDRTQLELMLSGTQELTKSDSTSKQRQFLLSDLRLGVRRRLYTFTESKTAVSGEFFDYLPTSIASRGATMVTALEGRVSLTQPVGDFAFSLRSSFRKNFHRYTSPVVEARETGLATCLAREGGNERINALNCTAGGNNTSFVLNHRLLASYAPFEKVSFLAMYTLAHAFTYDGFDTSPDDCDPTQPASCARGGVGATAGRGRRDTQIGALMATYQPARNLAFTLGLFTASSPRSSDDRRIRFPFFDGESPASNLTTYFLSVTLTEPFAFSKNAKEDHAKNNRD